MVTTTKFLCRACYMHKDVKNMSETKYNTCKACDERISNISQSRYKPSAKKVYREDKIKHIVPKLN